MKDDGKKNTVTVIVPANATQEVRDDQPATAQQVYEAVLRATELAYSFAASLDVGEDREFAFEVHDRLRQSTRRF